MKRIFFIAILSALIASCERPVNPEPQPGPSGNGKTYICQLPVVEFGKEAWVPGDKILFHGGSSDNQMIVTLKAEDIIDDTLFTVDLSSLKAFKPKVGKSKYFAAYPADNVKNQGQCEDKNTFVQTNNLLMTGYDVAKDTIVFKYITGGLVFTVNGDFDSYEIKGNFGEIVGFDQVTCRINDKFNIPGMNQVGEKTSLTGSVAADGTTVNKIYFPYPQPDFQDGFKLYFIKDGKRVKVLDRAGELGIHRDSFIDLGDITSLIEDYKEADNSEHEPEVLPDYSHLNHISFTECDDIFPNPERGFYFVQSFKSAKASLLTASKIEQNRLQNRTICYLGFYPKQYMNGHISEDFIQMVRNNMQVLRENGAKCIMRFAYSDSENEKPWDPTPEVVQMHIADIKPVLQEYSDVIMCLQAGFVGVWGEWYYTENFEFTPSTPEDHVLRKQVTDAMLEALPAERSIGLRTPMFKKNMYADSYTDTLTLATAYDGSAKARICAFNDCFGASSDDYGTFNGSKSREYWKKDTRYTLMGGETCGISDYCKCKQSMKDLEDYHWTYLNQGYNADVLSRWESEGCMNDVKRRLGYRLSLVEVSTSKAPAAGEAYRVKFDIKNSGFAAPANPRAVELVFVDGSGNKTVYKLKDVDPRYWFAGQTNTVDVAVTLPKGAAGKCAMYLNLPDPRETIHDNPLYAVRLANEGVWDSETGYNKIAEFTL